jgi:hypothetical protein
MKKNNKLLKSFIKTLSILIFFSLLFFHCSCYSDNVKISKIPQDINLYEDKIYIIDADIPDIRGSINIGGNAVLKVINAGLEFELYEDLQYGICLEDNAKIIIKNSTITSEDKMWEFELRDNASIEVIHSQLGNHSAVKLFNNTRLDGSNSLIEELRMDNYGIAVIDNCEIYPNLQFFFSISSPLEFPEPYSYVDFKIDNPGAWKLYMTKSIAQGWQVDVYPGTDLTIQNSKDVNLGLRSNGQLSDTINITNPHDGTPVNFTLDQFGFTLNIINTEIYFINLYLKDNDKLKVIGQKNGNTYNTTFLEIVLNGNADLTVEDSHIFGQLFHANENSKVTVKNCLIGSDDPEDPINSEFGVKNNAVGYAENCDITNSDIIISEDGKLTLKNCQYDLSRVTTSDNGQLAVR